MKIEAHLLQNFAPSCLNRDDTNTPKDCEFGGVRRARVSSQCFKRAVREHFRTTGSVPVGARTKMLKGELLKHLNDLSGPELSGALDAFLRTYYANMDSKAPDNTNVLLFLSPPEIEAAATAARAEWEKLRPVGAAEAEVKRLIESGMKAEDARKKAKVPEYKADKSVRQTLELAALSPDIALFGRMLAEQTSMKVEAACQVAQALSTHRVDLETDFFSAIDDLQKDRPDAGMLGITGFNSACFYRYALLDCDALQKHLGADVAAQTARAFLEAFVNAIPSGKQNSMAAQNAPSFGLFVVRDGGMPLSLANAFVRPVEARQEGGDLVTASIRRLTDYWERLTRVYGENGISSTSLFCVDEMALGALASADQGSVEATLDTVMTALNKAPAQSANGVVQPAALVGGAA